MRPVCRQCRPLFAPRAEFVDEGHVSCMREMISLTHGNLRLYMLLVYYFNAPL